MYRETGVGEGYMQALVEQKCCPFCEVPKQNIISTTPNFITIGNKYPYRAFDMTWSAEHRLIITRQHLLTLDEAGPKMREEYADLLIEALGSRFDFFTRANDSIIKSQEHFHTHLVRSTGRRIQELHYVADPYSIKIR